MRRALLVILLAFSRQHVHGLLRVPRRKCGPKLRLRRTCCGPFRPPKPIDLLKPLVLLPLAPLAPPLLFFGVMGAPIYGNHQRQEETEDRVVVA